MNCYFEALGILSDQNTLWGISIDTIFTTFITILIFVIGHLLIRFFENRKEEKRLKVIRLYFFNFLEPIPEAINNLMKEYLELSEAIAKQSHQDLGLGESHELYLDAVNKLSHVDLFKALISSNASNKDLKSKHLKNVFDAFEFIRLQNNRVKNNFSYFMGEYKKYENSWDENFNMVLRYFDSIISFAKQNNIRPSEDPFLKKLDELFHPYSKNKNLESRYQVEEDLINPLKKLCVDNIADTRALTLLPTIITCRKVFEDIINLKDNFSLVFKDEAEKLKQIKDSLAASLAFFKSQHN